MKLNERIILISGLAILAISALGHTDFSIILLFILSIFLLLRFSRARKIQKYMYNNSTDINSVSINYGVRSVPLISTRGMIFKVSSVDPNHEIQKIL